MVDLEFVPKPSKVKKVILADKLYFFAFLSGFSSVLMIMLNVKRSKYLF